MAEPGNDQRPHQGDPWGAFRQEMGASFRREVRSLPRTILEGLAEVAIVVTWLALCIVIGVLVGWLAAGDSGILLGGLAGFLAGGFGIVMFYVVVFFSAGAFGVQGLRRRRRERRNRQP